jgi:hypothetical protein
MTKPDPAEEGAAISHGYTKAEQLEAARRDAERLVMAAPVTMH